MAEPTSLNAFVEKMLTQAGMTNLPADFRRQYVTKLTQQLQERVGLRALQELDEEQLANFETLVRDKSNAAAVFGYFQTHVHDFPQKMAVVMEDFRQEFIDHSKNARKELQTAGT